MSVVVVVVVMGWPVFGSNTGLPVTGSVTMVVVVRVASYASVFSATGPGSTVPQKYWLLFMLGLPSGPSTGPVTKGPRLVIWRL